MDQTATILDHLKTKGPITALDAQELYGIQRLGARIWDLREAGQRISKETVEVRNRHGFPCHVARYQLDAPAPLPALPSHMNF